MREVKQSDKPLLACRDGACNLKRGGARLEAPVGRTKGTGVSPSSLPEHASEAGAVRILRAVRQGVTQCLWAASRRIGDWKSHHELRSAHLDVCARADGKQDYCEERAEVEERRHAEKTTSLAKMLFHFRQWFLRPCSANIADTLSYA